MNGPFTFDQLVGLIGGRLRHDVACQLCAGAPGRTKMNRDRRVLRIWHPEPGFVTFYCSRCDTSGYTVDDGREPVSRADLEKIRRRAETFDREQAAKKLETARWLWSMSKPIVGTIAERYLRGPRGIAGTLPGTLRFKPATNGYPPALIGAFGLPAEPEPGALMIVHTEIAGVHLTRLKPDGSGKDERDGPAKIMLARSRGWPLVLAPPNDSGGMAIVEGIEEGLTALMSGLGIWVAGSASRLPALAERIPDYVNEVTIFADTDDDGNGMRHAHELKRRLRARGLFAAIVEAPEKSR